MARTAKLTIRLPQDELDFVRRYATKHSMTLTDLVSRYFRRLQHPRNPGKTGIHPDVAAISGLLPADIDMRREHRQHQGGAALNGRHGSKASHGSRAGRDHLLIVS